MGYGNAVERFELRPPAGACDSQRGVCRELIHAWEDIVTAQKVYQHNDLTKGIINEVKLPRDWGSVNSAQDMPILVWLYLPPHADGCF